jgi:hypothetical protein
LFIVDLLLLEGEEVDTVFCFPLAPLSFSLSLSFSFSRDGVLVSFSAEVVLELLFELMLVLVLVLVLALERPDTVPVAAGWAFVSEPEEERADFELSALGLGEVSGVRAGVVEEAAWCACDSAACFSASLSENDLDSARLLASAVGACVGVGGVVTMAAGLTAGS